MLLINTEGNVRILYHIKYDITNTKKSNMYVIIPE